MTSFSFWQRWLFVIGVVISILGFMVAFLSGTPLFGLINRLINPVFWNTTVVGDGTIEFQKWVYGVWGATIAGWGILLTFIAHYPYNKREKWAWNCVALGLLIWFVLDTGLSLNYKVYFNVVFNVALFILAGLPIIFTRRHFA